MAPQSAARLIDWFGHFEGSGATGVGGTAVQEVANQVGLLNAAAHFGPRNSR